MRRIVVVALSLTLVLITRAVLAVDIDSVRLWRSPDSTRVVFDLSGPVEHQLFTLENPARLVIDLRQAKLDTSLAGLPLDNTPISRVRSGVHQKTDLRVVFDLSESVKPRSFLLKKTGDKKDRLVIDLVDRSTSSEKSVATLARSAVTPSGSYRDILIAIDAGHGGEDPGAIGARGLREKDVVLDISRQLVALINKTPGFKAFLVRTGDYYIPLRERRDIARAKRADLFVSVHADAFTKPQAHGVSVYALSLRGATSETARFLADKENASDLIGGVGDLSLAGMPEDVQNVLVDLAMTATLNSSLEVGKYVLGPLDRLARLHKKQVEQAGFAVLKSPDVPSILVETGFISNPQEAKKLGTRRYRQQLAQAIASGVIAYFDRHLPEGTYLAARKRGVNVAVPGGKFREYVIARGDTLSAIAQRHRISVAELRKINNLTTSVIKIGQRLKIPAS